MKVTAVAFFLAAMSGAAQAGVTLKTVDGESASSVVSIEGNKLRVEGDKHLLIFDGDKKELISADPRSHSYSVSTEADMKKMGTGFKTQMDAQQAKMRKQMASMPPEQRKQMESMMKQMEQSGGPHASGRSAQPAKAAAPEKVKYERLGEKQQVAGLPCEMYRVVRGQDREEKTCFIPWSEGTVKKDELKAFDGLASFMDAMTQGMSGSREGASNDWSRELRNAPGIPARIIDASGKTTMELKSIQRGAIGKDKFAAPAGYQKSSKPMFGE